MSMIEKLSKKHIKRIIGITSGKGGVGKSTLAVLLAEAFAAHGYEVGILDGDITGPSIPRLLGVEKRGGEGGDNVLYPAIGEQGIRSISINMFLREEEEPVIWRGPLLTKALLQFYDETEWGQLDYLIIDFPPGTADIMLTAYQQLPLDGVIAVLTPQDFVSMIVTKAVRMAKKSGIPVLGFVENMGSVVCPHCKQEFSLFAQNPTDAVVDAVGLPILAKLPWREELAHMGALRWVALPHDIQRMADAFATQVDMALTMAQ